MIGYKNKEMIRHIKREEFVQKVRVVNNVTIFFASKDTIYAKDESGACVLCERWFEGRFGYAQKWRPFNQVLLHKKSIETIRDVWRIALRYEISAMTPRKFPKIPSGVKFLEENK